MESKLIVKNLEIDVKGSTVKGTLWSPENELSPLVIISPAPPGRSKKENREKIERYDRIAEKLAQDGLGIMVFNPRGVGLVEFNQRSEGRFTIANYIEDVKIILEKIWNQENKEFKNIDINRIGLFGHCGGGIAVLMAAQDNDKVKSIIIYGVVPVTLPLILYKS